MTDSYILEVASLTKVYKNFTAVDSISFAVKKGEVVGLLGPNGAGKTTTIQMLLGITKPTSGSIKYFGRDFEKHRQYCLSRMNTASAYNSLQGRITVWENLKVFSGLYGMENNDQQILDLVKRLEIEDVLNSQYYYLSSGQKTRVNLVKSLINNPKLILMDEPTASLDPDIADKILSLIEELKEKNEISLLYTSHDMDEVTRICDRVIFLNQGKIIAMDTPLGLTKLIKRSEIRITFDGDKTNVRKYLTEKEISFKFPRKQVAILEIEEEKIPKIIFGLSNKAGVWITDIDIKKPNLEDVFLNFARSREEHVS